MKVETVTTYTPDTKHGVAGANVLVRWNGWVGIVEETNYDPYEREKRELVLSTGEMLFLAKVFLAILLTEEGARDG